MDTLYFSFSIFLLLDIHTVFVILLYHTTGISAENMSFLKPEALNKKNNGKHRHDPKHYGQKDYF